MVATFLELSNFNSWPEPGGLNNQDDDLLGDILKYFSLKSRIKYEVKQGMFRTEQDELDFPTIGQYLSDG